MMKKALIFGSTVFVLVLVATLAYKAGRIECSRELQAGDLYSHLNTYLRSYEDLNKAENLADIEDVKVRLILASSAIAGYLNNNPTLIEQIEKTSPHVKDRLADVKNHLEGQTGPGEPGGTRGGHSVNRK